MREAASPDFEAVVDLYRQLHPQDPVITDGSDRVAFDEILAAPGLTLYVLEHDHRVVATTYLNVIPNMTRSAAPYAVIENVVVAEDLRGRGFGKTIMAGTLQAAWDRGCYKVMLMTGSRRPSTHGFYRACGLSAEEKTGYSMRRP